jgi:ABC-type nitrate/sulfonate/bicarbonate transport system substrate-binding protein
MKGLFFCFILSVALPVTTLAQTPSEPVRITYASRTIESVLLFVAQEKSFFREEGLEVQPVLTGGDDCHRGGCKRRCGRHSYHG